MTAQNLRRLAAVSLGLLLALNLVNYIDRQILPAVVTKVQPLLLPGDPSANEKMGDLQLVFIVSYMLLSPLFGFLGDRWNRWVIMGVGILLWSLASGASGLAHSYTMLLWTRVFVGVGEAAYGPVAPTIIADLYPVETRGRAMSWFYMAIPIGSALGYVVGGGAAWLGSWRWGFYSMTIPGVLLAIWCFMMPEPVRLEKVHRAKPKLADYLAILRIPSYLYNCIGMTALTFAIGGIAFWLPKYIVRKSGMSEAQAGIILGAITVTTGFLGTLAGGILGDKLRGRIRGAYFIVSGVGLLLAFPFFLLMLKCDFPLAWVMIFIAEFWLFFNTGPSNTALANVTPAPVRASAFALNILIIHLFGDAISPKVIGAITDRYGGDMNRGFLAVGTVMLLGGIAWLIGSLYLDRDTQRVDHPEGDLPPATPGASPAEVR
jgi:MFS transporter, Spinster family, sphingosine-1-phosphate transporter